MKLSIITINKNNASGLEKTIESVCCQTFKDYEYIVIDGDSSDNSVEVIKRYSESIHYWTSEPDNGMYQAMNKGIKKSTGEYLIFMNSGDCFATSNTLEKVFEQKRDADLVAGNILLEGRFSKIRKSYPDKITFYYLSVNAIWHQATFFKKNLFEEIGMYDENFRIASDWKFILLALVKYNKSIEFIDMDIALMDTCGISNTKQAIPTMEMERDNTIKEYFPYFYDDYKELYKLKRFSFERVKIHIRWRLQHFLYKKC